MAQASLDANDEMRDEKRETHKLLNSLHKSPLRIPPNLPISPLLDADIHLVQIVLNEHAWPDVVRAREAEEGLSDV